MLGLRGSFLGFTYNNIHSSILGITRTINQGKDTKELSPAFQNQIFGKPAGNGELFFSSNYTNRVFNINFAFEEITEQQLKTITSKWNDKKIHELIFDEEPYKVYSAKITGMALMKTLAFSINNKRVYRGEGSITFTCFYPFARSRYEYLEEYTVQSIPEWASDIDSSNYNLLNYQEDEVVASNSGFIVDDAEEQQTLEGDLVLLEPTSEYININEWRAASRIPSIQNVGWNEDSKEYTLYNAGDIAISPKFYFLLSDNAQTITIKPREDAAGLSINNVQPKSKNQVKDKYLLIDFENQTLFGCNENLQLTGHFYNEYLTQRDFFEIPAGEQKILLSSEPFKIDFNYLYL